MAPNNFHGPNFELKLLTLFFIRALDAGYKFELSREREDMGGKLDDVIFRYEVDTAGKQHWRYRYVQAKHKQKKTETIAAIHLIGEDKDNLKGEFHLLKYFHSFFNIRARGEDIHDCIICTNIGFGNLASLEKDGIELVSIDDQPEDILKFGAPTARYKLKVKDEFRRKLREEWSPVRLLAEELKDCATKKKKTETRAGMLNSYHVALVDEHVIDCKTKELGIFHQDFLSEAENLSDGARELRQTISTLVENDEWKKWKFTLSNNFGKSKSTEDKNQSNKESQSIEVKNPLPKQVKEADITEYFDKLIFVVNMPNEENFDQIIETEDLSKYYSSENCENQRRRIINDEIPRAFRDPLANVWLTSEEGKRILLAGVTDVSSEYQKQLKEKVGFRKNAIQEMKKELKQIMDFPRNNQVQRIFTPSPQLTAVKLISVVQELKKEEKYLVVPSSRLQDKEEMKRWTNILKLQKGFHHFLVVVCDDAAPVHFLENLFADHQDDTNFGIIISRGEELAEKEEEIKYTNLTEDFQNKILSKTVSLFQEEEKTLTVRDLVGDKPEEVIDFRSIEELLLEKKEIKIPSFNTSSSELYIKRELRFPINDQFELDGKCKISSDGHIEWFVEEKERKEVWKKIMEEITNRASKSKPVPENHLKNSIENKEKERSVVIISGVAGSGKSTILSHYYHEIKMRPGHWVIRINLVDHYESILKMGIVTRSDAVDFLVNQLHVIDEKSSFSRSLLKNRLETGDRIVFLFDGFDEINEKCQEKAIQLMKVINEEKSIPLYVTTRTHMLDKLQFEFSQLAYILENFTENDQTDCLVNYWKNKLSLEEKYDGLLRQFAESLIDRVSKTLNDQEKSFIGIPLQCRILAECFQSNVKELIETPTSTEHNISRLLVDQKFDLISLYDRLMETKRKIFREEKAKDTNPNEIVEDSSNWFLKEIKNHLTKLAIETIFSNWKLTKVLWPSHSSHLLSDNELADEENRITSNGLKFGLTLKIENDAKIQFLHRTYAEYLFAKYLYKGFLLDEKRHNKLLENESIQRLILEEILIKREYDGVRVFFNGMLKRIVDEKEWRNIKTRHLPDRLKNFIDHFYNRLHTMPTYRFPYYRENALFSSLEDGNFKIFALLCDCLDSTLDETQIETVMMKCFVLGDTNYFLFKYFRTTESKVFERFIGYFKNNTREVLLKLDPFGLYRFPSCISSYFSNSINRSEMYSDWNGEEQNKTLDILLQLIENALSTKDKKPLQNSKMFDVLKNVLTFSMIHENDENLLIKLTRVLAQEIDDSDFAELFKESFCLKNKHLIIRGRIKTVLAILRDLKKNQLLIKMRRTVLKIHPEAFQRIYLPEVKGEDVTATDLNMLMEPDSYGMPRLHKAAFYGDTKEFDEIFEKLSEYKDKETKQVMAEFMFCDEDGFTPFYIVTIRGHEEIYNKMLAFMKQNIALSILEEKHLTCRYSFELLSLYDAIESENIEMFHMILKVVKKELGPLEFIQVLCRPNKICFEIYGDLDGDENCEVLKSIFKSIEHCERKNEFGNAIVKIAVMRDDDVYKDYKDLYDLIFHDEASKEIVPYIDAEDLKELKDVANFTKQFLERWTSKKRWTEYILHLLRHFTNDQLEQFVDTITSKNEIKIKIGKAYLNFYFFLIFKCLNEREVGDDYLKKFLLSEDEKGFIVTRLTIKNVKEMLTCLSEERQEEVTQEWKNTALPMRTFFSLTGFKLKSKKSTARYWPNILMFYLKYGSQENLTEFVEIVTDLLKEKKGRCSVLSFILENEKYAGKVTIREILKLVSEKEETGILGPNAAIRMMIHEIDKIPFIIKAMLLGKDIGEWLGILPQKIREEIQGFMILHAPKFIDQAFREPQTLYFHKRIQTLTSFLNYSNEKQLGKFVHNITLIPNNTKKQKKSNDSDSDSEDSDSEDSEFEDSDSEDSDSEDSDSTSSTWVQAFRPTKRDFESAMDKFMKIVSEKLGSNAVKELILHMYKETPITFNILKEVEKMLLMAMLSAEDITKLQAIATKNKKKQKKTKNKIKAMILIPIMLFFLITPTTWSRIWNQ